MGLGSKCVLSKLIGWLAVCAVMGGGARGQLLLEKAGTEDVYFSYQGKALLSFGGLSDFIFYASEDSYNWKLWVDWAVEHGMNHVRAYPPLSWKHVEAFAQENGGSASRVLFPYLEVEPGSRKFDLRRFNPVYWKRFREKCEYLQSKGVILHLIMWNGWQLRAADTEGNPSEIDWDGHFFNPANNVNAFTEPLGGDLENRFKIYHSMEERDSGLVNTQRWWFHKVLETTIDLDNVYYDLIHELSEHYRDWDKTSKWIEEMALTVRNVWIETNPDRPMILGMDTGGLSDEQRKWVFEQPYFDVLIYGKKHSYEQARKWRREFRKPYVPQESWDENGEKYSYRCPNQRVATRKYMWKFMMARCQQLDLYVKPRTAGQASGAENPPGYPHNYDPRGWNPFEDDALVLRGFWNSLKDFGAMEFEGKVAMGPGRYRYVLSGESEAIVYCSSGMGQEGVSFPVNTLRVRDLGLADGAYSMDIVAPAVGLLEIRAVEVQGGRLAVELPAFTDDIVVHMYKGETE